MKKSGEERSNSVSDAVFARASSVLDTIASGRRRLLSSGRGGGIVSAGGGSSGGVVGGTSPSSGGVGRGGWECVPDEVPLPSPSHAIFFRQDVFFPEAGTSGSQTATMLLEKETLVYSQFMKAHRCYDLIPTSTKVLVFDTELGVRKAFFALVYNGVRAAPLWDSAKQEFVGMLTITDFIRILHKYYKAGQAEIPELEEHRISTWREAVKALRHPDEPASPKYSHQLISIDPSERLHKAVQTLCHYKVHRLPVVERSSGNVLYILTHKRILRFLFLYLNDLPRPGFLEKTPKELGIGTWENVQTVSPDTPLIEALEKFLSSRVSALPVVDASGKVVDIYAKFDVINLAADKAYNDLHITVTEALKHRSDWFEGVRSCGVGDSLWRVMEALVKAEVHRMLILDGEGRVAGLVSLSDILSSLVLRPELLPDSGKGEEE